jgi:anti-anti-sigma factor
VAEERSLELQSTMSRETVDGLKIARLAFEGDLDLRVVDEFREAISPERFGDADAVVVDLRELRFIDSAGIHALVKAWELVREGGRPGRVVIARGSNLERVLDLTGLLDRLDRTPDHDSAVEAVAKGT